MRRHLSNAGFGILDYISYPLGMLIVAPIVLHRMGAAEYGLWMIATSIISAGSIMASGFGDACIQRVAQMRGTGGYANIPHTVQSMLAINGMLGLLFALGVWYGAPYLASRMAVSHTAPVSECLIALRIASILILVRAIESVAVGVQRAFEQYRITVQVSSAARLLVLGSAAVLAWYGQRTVGILVATALIMTVASAVQLNQARTLVGAAIWPRFCPGEMRLLCGRGVFIWLQSLGGIAFSQLDRILLGTYLGALAVAPYSLCVQFAHPIYGLTGAALNFLFPYLSVRAATQSPAASRHILMKALALNLVLVAFPTVLLLIFGERIIEVWAGASVAKNAAPILPPIVLGAALVGLSVTGAYAVQALGLFRTAAYINVTGRAAMLLPMILLLRAHGLAGLAVSRLFYGSVSLVIYLPLIQRLRVNNELRDNSQYSIVAIEAQEGSKP
jgi:O-antigen/teichoic acid export membrane protein